VGERAKSQYSLLWTHELSSMTIGSLPWLVKVPHSLN